jgi:hypothetical protein
LWQIDKPKRDEEGFLQFQNCRARSYIHQSLVFSLSLRSSKKILSSSSGKFFFPKPPKDYRCTCLCPISCL